MSNKRPLTTTLTTERAFIVGVEIYGKKPPLALEDSLAELALLSKTAGLEVVGELTQKLERPNVVTYIGPGKVQELKNLAEETHTDVIVFDEELSPRHQRELEEALGSNLRVIDRTALILDIFAQHAHTNEGMLQVELAQYEYYLPRLTRAWTHLERQAGGGGGRTGSIGGVGLRGPGETQLEVDRRKIRRRISVLKQEIEKIRGHRMRYRAQRKRSLVPTVALIGYTNAGKSTLLNKLAKSDVYVANQLFATLDPTTRRVALPAGETALFTDTVGFIQKLPTALIAAFRATLEEISEADLLVHVLDISHPNALNHNQIVHETLKVIHADLIPVITALNKIDRLKNAQVAREIIKNYDNAVAVSAKNDIGIADLLHLVKKEMFESYRMVKVRLPYAQGALISLFHDFSQVKQVTHERGGVVLRGRIPGRFVAQFAPWQLNGADQPPAGERKENEQ